MSRFTLLLGIVLLATPALAQPTSFGIGGQIGDPTGISLRIGGPGTALDLAAGWNLSDDRLFAQLHLILAQPPLGTPSLDLRLFYGPGGFVGINGDVASLGISFNAGLSVYFGRVEIFGQLTPRLRLVEDTDFELGGGVGLRYYL